MPPQSYQGPLQGEDDKDRTFSQTTGTGMAAEGAGNTVASIISEKGDDVYGISPDMKVQEVVEELHRFKIGVLLVLDDKHDLVGIVSERDIVYGLNNNPEGLMDQDVRDIMTPDPVTCTPEDQIQVVMEKMTEGRFRHMPVMKNGVPAGMISIRDVVHHRLKELEYENLKIKQLIVG